MALADLPVIDHDLFLSIDEGTQSVTVRDRIVLSQSDPAGTRGLPDLSLSSQWHISSLAFDAKPVEVQGRNGNGNIEVPSSTTRIDIVYGGKVDDSKWPYILWMPGDGWYPEGGNHRVRFKLALDGPSGWSFLTQGVPDSRDTGAVRTWIQDDPQQGIYLAAGPWHSYSKQAGDYRAGVMLIDRDVELSNAYLDATLEHLERYSRAIGAYPYHGFTLVENTRQTGWGMPGFTLLGSSIIRLPFIVHTSYPHEILHNWWGNGVFADGEEANWSEGLTTYLSDYLMRERGGEGRQYRLNTLIAWHDYAAGGSDFPLSRFVGRHDRATQAVGYGKGMFLFHMLRRELGDALFMSGLREFYVRHRYGYAGFGDIQQTFERICDCALDGFFSQWLTRKGAPALRLDAAVRRAKSGKHSVTAVISQSGDEPWRLRVPVRVIDTFGSVTTQSFRLDGSTRSFTFELDSPAARIDVDPEIELFRLLDEGEKPTTFSKLFAAEQVVISAADESFYEIAKELDVQNPNWMFTPAASGAANDADAVLLLGWGHPWARNWFQSRRNNEYRVNGAGMDIDGVSYEPDGRQVIALVDTVTIGGDSKTVMWMAARDDAGLVDLMRRLSHYGRFSYAVFSTAERRAATTGQWRGQAQTLSRVFHPGTSAILSQPAPSSLF